MKFLILISSLAFTTKSYSEQYQKTDRQEVNKVVKNELNSIKTCYEDGLKNNPNIKGRIVIEWDIELDGSVSKARVKSSTLNDEVVENCIVEKIKVLKFPAPPTNSIIKIYYPFVFSKN